ncbi:putative reverse transcriptase domain-containing protein [Tanacetum coccineum]
MPPKQMSQAAIAKLVADEVTKALAADRATKNATGVGGPGNVGGAGNAGGPEGAQLAKECTFSSFIKCGPTQFHVATLSLAVANEQSWDDLKKMMLEEFCPEEEISRMEDELRNLRLKDHDIAAYTTDSMNWSYYGETYSSKTTTLNEAIRMAHGLMEHKVQGWKERNAEQNKRKSEGGNQGNNQGNRNNNRGDYRDNRHHNQNNNRRNGGARAINQAQNENVNQGGHALKCNRCNMFHFGNCPAKCNKCEKRRHITRDCRGKGVATGANAEPIRVCFKCGDPNHLANSELYPERKKQGGRNANGHVYAMKDVDQAQGPNVVTELGTFDVIIGMDWLVAHDAVIICGKKEVHILIKNRTLVVKGDSNSSRLKVISCIKARKYIERGCHLFLAHVTEKEKSEKRLKDVLVICDFPEVFPDNLPGLPPP